MTFYLKWPFSLKTMVMLYKPHGGSSDSEDLPKCSEHGKRTGEGGTVLISGNQTKNLPWSLLHSEDKCHLFSARLGRMSSCVCDALVYRRPVHKTALCVCNSITDQYRSPTQLPVFWFTLTLIISNISQHVLQEHVPNTSRRCTLSACVQCMRMVCVPEGQGNGSIFF